jgi:type IV pilus assembly protein PilO
MQYMALSKMGDWPHSAKWAVIIFNALIILLLGYWLLIEDLSQKLLSEEKQWVILNQIFLTKQYAIKNLPGLQKQVRDLQLLLAAQINSDVETIITIGAQLSLQFLNIKFLPEKIVNGFGELPIQLSLISNYEQISKFITLLVQAKPLIGIQSFTIGEHEVELLTSVYRSLGVGKPGVNTNKEPAPVVNSQSDPFHMATADTLETFPLHLLHMVGVVQQGEKIWALIAAPDNKIYSVTAGMRLDNDGKVLRIDADKVVIAKANKTIILRLVSKS